MRCEDGNALMALPWVRLDTNMPSHDKVLALLADPSPKRHQAAFSWTCSLAWAGGAGTDGFIPAYALSAVHGTPATARLLEKYALWDEGVGGWHVRNYAQRQELNVVAEMKRAGRTASARKANCVRHHGPDCGCWLSDSEVRNGGPDRRSNGRTDGRTDEEGSHPARSIPTLVPRTRGAGE